MPTFERLSGWDYATWLSASEDPAMRSTMVGLLVMEKSPNWATLVDHYERASRTVTILRKRIVEGPVGIANPRLVVDPSFDLTFHLRRFLMPEGSTWEDVLDEARRQSMTDFDRDRPLWKVTLLEGLPDGRAVMISKLHHAIADGQGAMALGAALVDIAPEGYDRGPMPDEPESAVLTPRRFAEIMIQDNSEWVVNTAAALLRNAVPSMINFITAPQETVEKITATVASIARMANSPTKPLSPIMDKRSHNYHFATFQVTFSEMKVAAKSGGHTINDVFLASIARGMARYHETNGSPVSELHINMPISTRKSGEAAQNAVTIARFDLPLDEADSNKLMDSLSATVKRMRGEPAMEYTDQLGEISRFIPKELLLTGAQASDVTASNIPGPPIAVYLAGARVEAIVPLPPPIGAAVFVALMTYNGIGYIGCALDDAAVKDRDVFMSCLRDGFAEVIGSPVSADSPLSEPVAAPATVRVPKKPAAKRPEAKKPAAKRPEAAKRPTVKKPAAKRPEAAKRPAVKKPAVKKPAVKKPAVKKPAVKKPTSKP